ncbi:NPCBM-associated, NEW3 domain of alpha-galactosidase family protein [Mycobacterium xenopi 3993]|nr:NPCBM-associated, NEW3 domain of alpha-galactosidase family protein [Mycobacterium xenopi 3993]
MQLGALKAAGNRWPAGGQSPSTPPSSPCGWSKPRQRHRVRVGSTLGTVSGVCSADLLEDRRPHQPASVLHGYQIATLTARLEMPQVLDAQAALGPEAEAAQPLYARYWLHNRGPPARRAAAVAYLHPHTVAAEPGSEVVLRLTVASDCTDTEVRGTLTLVCPHGWVAGPASCR